MNMGSNAITYLVMIILVILIFQFIGASLMAQSAEYKGYGSESHILAICFWLGIFGYMYAISLPDLTLQKQNELLLKKLDMMDKKEQPQLAENLSDELPDL